MAARRLTSRLLVLLLVLPAVASAQEAGASAARDVPAPLGALGQYVPGDVWLYVCHVHTPAQGFLRPHWQRVFAALKTCGIEQEFKHLISRELRPEQKATFEQTWAELADTLGGITWSDLIAREFVFAERFGGLVPDIMLLCRPQPETLDENVARLGRLFALLDSFDKNDDITYTEGVVDGVRTWSLEARRAPLGVFMLHKNDVVAIVVGRTGMVDVRSLLAGTGGAAPQPIVDQPRFRAALAEVPQAECSLAFLDFDRLLKAMHRLPEMMFGEKEAPVEFATTGKRVLGTIVTHLDFIDYGITTARMEDRQEYAHGCFRLKPGCQANACHRMVANRQPLDDFARYVPAEAEGFSASTFIDLGVLYATILDTIRTVLPDGAAVCEKWARLQAEWEFDVEEDVLSWLSGEYISVSLPAMTPSPFAGGDCVLLVRVKDPTKAAAKMRAGLDRAVPFLVAHGQPVSLREAAQVPAEGFQSIHYAMLAAMGIYPCVGVWDQWLVVGSSESAIAQIIETAAGRRANILENARYQREGIVPAGPVRSVSFRDLSNWGQQMRGTFVAVGFFGAMLPDERDTRPVKAILNAIGRLVPVFEQIDFFSSTSAATVFRDGAWHSTTVITYKPPRASATAEKPGN